MRIEWNDRGQHVVISGDRLELQHVIHHVHAALATGQSELSDDHGHDMIVRFIANPTVSPT